MRRIEWRAESERSAIRLRFAEQADLEEHSIGGNLAQQVYVYGVDGQKIGTYTFTLAHTANNTPEMTNSTVQLATFFGHKRIGTFDRLGSAKYNQRIIKRSRSIHMGRIGGRQSRTMR